MNYISCMIRIIEIPNILLSQSQIPCLFLRVEMSQTGWNETSTIIDAKIYGNLAYDIQNYYYVNDYALIEGYFLTDLVISSERKIMRKKIPALTISQIYPLFFKI